MLKWKLKDYLTRHNLSVYALTQTADVAPNTVYALARGEHERISLDVFDKVLAGLERLTGEPVGVADLLERESTPDDDLEVIDVRDRIKRFESGEAKLIPWEQVKAEQRAKRGL